MSDLGEFFKIVAEQEKRKKAEAEVLNALAEHLSKISETKEAPVSEEKFEEELSELETDLLESADVALEEVKPAPLREVSLGPISGNTTTKTSDPLTPLDKRYATKADIEQHYRTYVARIQQQLSTLGGGGEVNLRYLDDVDRSTISDGRWLKYNGATGKFEFDEINPYEVVHNTTIVDEATYIVNDTDYYIGVNYAGTVTITLPSSPNSGRLLVIKDESGNAETNPITVTGTVDNDAGGFVLGLDNGSITLIYRSGWRIV